jgi:hypothetical protein
MDSRFRGNDREGQQQGKNYTLMLLLFYLLLFLIVAVSVEKFH